MPGLIFKHHYPFLFLDWGFVFFGYNTCVLFNSKSMSDLREALDRILNWTYQQYQLYSHKYGYGQLSPQKEDLKLLGNDRHEVLLKLNPGLSNQEIDVITKDLPFKIPCELYELYQWKNGTSSQEAIDGLDWIFDVGQGWNYHSGFYLVPLQEVVEEYLERQELYINSLYFDHNTINNIGLRLFKSSDCNEGYIIIDENQIIKVRFHSFKGGGDYTIAIFPDLTAMMQTVADCYEQAYYRQSDGYLNYDGKIAREIWQKYNSQQIVERTLYEFQAVEALLSQMPLNSEIYYFIKFEYDFKIVGDALKFTEDTRLLDTLIRFFCRPPFNDKRDEGLNHLRTMATLFIPSNSIDAVEAFIFALKNEYWYTRYWAAHELGYSKNAKAIAPLIELLEDCDQQVRRMVRDSIQQLVKKLPELEDQIPF
ncbi:hypothetical protein C7H19_03395 [Aphanothece hegewaldii CCALA 016]|uniref:Knr4/Smi1-like domain-containing protein n=2 Tax=Aphanothece TaxID=1121 RepID=A0A2T1M2Y9_9CHRO|nr:hypothetical protein C7H19_03395 [Aphanothece hegewaldii CCALA 016]